jgi:hypothetical protein
MRNTTSATRSASTLLRRGAAALALAGAVIVPRVSDAQRLRCHHRVGAAGDRRQERRSGLQAITRYRVGAPSEYEVSYYGGSHKHLWVEQQLYGPGVVVVPHVDTTVQQSR